VAVTESFRTQDGRTLAYHREGTGPMLVCHPGGPGFSSRYLADLAGLGGTFTLILLDPRGTGGSEPASSYATSDYSADLEAVRIHLELEHMDLLGHSHGGIAAVAYAAAHPAGVRRLIVANSLVRLHPEAMEAAMQERREEPWYDDARAALEQESAGEYESEDELADITHRFWPMYFARYDDTARAYIEESIAPERPNPHALREFNDGLETWDMRGELPLIKSPTLVITGERDFITGPACSEDIAAGIVGAELVIVPGCGHFTFVECPERFRTEVARFLT
jgi:proline-specific peptidase